MMQQVEYLRSLFFENKRYRPFILMAVYVVFVCAYLLLHHRIDYIVNFYFGIPLILAVYYYGFGWGMVLMLTEALLHWAIMKWTGDNWMAIYTNTRIHIAFFSLIVVGYIVSLFRKVKENLRLSEARYKSLSDELHKTNLAKDKFFSIIAHDLRGPIGAINSNIDLFITSQNELSEHEKHELMLALHSMSTRVFNLLENLLKWAVVQSGRIHLHFERLNVRQMCDESLQLFQFVAREKRIILSNQVPEHLMVKADRNALEAVVRNLMSNAIKFTWHNGRVELTASEHEGMLQLKIIDNGMGIRKEVQPHLFDSQHEVSSEGTNGEKGTGLGLMLSYELVRKCNGNLFVESEPGKGSTFTIELPAG